MRFGAIALLAGVISAPALGDDAVAERIGDWTLDTSIDEMSDAKTYTAQAKGVGGSVIFYCSEARRVSTMVASDKYLGGGWRSQEVQYRVDDQPSVTEVWSYGRDMISAPDKQFPKAIADGTSVLLRATAYNFASYDIKVPISGARDVINRIYGLCGKKSPLN